MKNFSLPLLVALTFFSVFTFAQKADTLKITPANIQISQLPMGSHQYLVYFKKGKDSANTTFQIWNINVKKDTYKGKPVIVVDQAWEDNTEVVHRVNSVNDAKDFHPLYQKSWWKGRGTSETDFEAKTSSFPPQMFRKNPDSSNRAATEAFLKAAGEYSLNWHLDLEVFSMLPYKEGRTFAINFYDAGFSPPALTFYTVTGSAQLKGLAGATMDCWILTHESPNNKETFYISKKTHEVLRLEQQFGKMFRFKVKLPG